MILLRVVVRNRSNPFTLPFFYILTILPCIGVHSFQANRIFAELSNSNDFHVYKTLVYTNTIYSVANRYEMEILKLYDWWICGYAFVFEKKRTTLHIDLLVYVYRDQRDFWIYLWNINEKDFDLLGKLNWSVGMLLICIKTMSMDG